MVSQALAALTPSLQSPIHLPVLISSLLSELKPIPSRISTYVAGLSLLPTLASSSHQDVPTIQHIEYCVRLVDQYLLNRWADPPADFTFNLRNQPAEKTRELGDALVSVCIASDIILRDAEMKDYHEAGMSVFSLLLILSSINAVFQRKSAWSLPLESSSTSQTITQPGVRHC